MSGKYHPWCPIMVAAVSANGYGMGSNCPDSVETGLKTNTSWLFNALRTSSWHHMGAASSEITSNSTIPLTACSWNQHDQHQSSLLLALCKGPTSDQWIPKRQWMWEAIPYPDFIMICTAICRWQLTSFNNKYRTNENYFRRVLKHCWQ